MMRPILDAQEGMNSLAENPPQVILSPLDASSYKLIRDVYQFFGLDIITSDIISYNSPSYIAYIKIPGHKIFFKYFQRIEIYFGFIFLIVMVFISFAITFFQKPLNLKFEYIFILFQTLFSPIMPKINSEKRSYSMILIGCWLLSVFLIKILFQNWILEDMVIVIPNRVIDSWDDLNDRPDVGIYVPTTDRLVKYCEVSKDQMALNFNPRLKRYDLNDIYNQTFVNQLISDLSTGKSALIESRNSLIYTLMHLNKVNVRKDRGFLERLHISKSGGGSVPYFTFVLEQTGAYLMPDYNRL